MGLTNRRSFGETALLLTVLTVGCGDEAETHLGAWRLADDVQLELYEDETYAFFALGDEGHLRSYSGTYRYMPADGRLEFWRGGSPTLIWEGVAIGDGQLAYTLDDRLHASERTNPVEDLDITDPSYPVTAIFGFDQELTAQLSQMGGEVEEWWLGTSSYRWYAEGFEGARLYRAVDPTIDRPYVTIDWWKSAEAAESLARLFRAGVFRVGPEYKGPEPSLFELADIADGGTGPGSGDANIIAFLEPPAGQDFDGLWSELRLVIQAADGYLGHRLYERVTVGGGERIGVAEFESVDHAQAVYDAPEFGRIIEAFGHPDRVGVFTPIAEDMAEGKARTR